MTFYNEPSFWVFLGSFVTSVAGLIKFYFSQKNKSNEKKATLSMSVENLKSDNIQKSSDNITRTFDAIQKSIDYLNGVIARIEPLVEKHDDTMANLDTSIKQVGMIEKNLTQMFENLKPQYAGLKSHYDGFERRIVNITASYQILLDEVGKVKKEIFTLTNNGKVILKK